MSKLTDTESEAAETQVWLEFAVRCGYMSREEAKVIYESYNEILKLVVSMINHPELWVIGYKAIQEEAEDYDTLF